MYKKADFISAIRNILKKEPTWESFNRELLSGAGIPLYKGKKNTEYHIPDTAIRKAILKGVDPAVIDAQRQFADTNRSNAANTYGLPAGGSTPIILPFDSKGNRTSINAKDYDAYTKYYTHNNPWTQLLPSPLGDSITRAVASQEETDGQTNHPRRIGTGFVPDGRTDPLAIFTHEYLHGRNVPIDQQEALSHQFQRQSDEFNNRKANMSDEQRRVVSENLQKMRDKLDKLPGRTSKGGSTIYPNMPRWRFQGPYADLPGSTPKVDYARNGVLYSPREHYFTGGKANSSYHHNAEAGTGIAQLVANEMVATNQFPQSYAQLLTSLKKRKALNTNNNGRLTVDQKKAFPRPKTIDNMSSGLSDFIEAENLAHATENDWDNTTPGIHINYNHGKPALKHVTFPRNLSGTHNWDDNRKARRAAQIYRDNLDALVKQVKL